MIPFIDLKAQYKELKSEIDRQIHEVLDSCSFIMGPAVDKAERALEAYTGAKHALTCSNGTDALVMALMALDVGHGDEVIVPAFSFFATAECVNLVGARPVFVDIEDESYNIDVKQVEAAITPQTKAIIFVSLYGQVPDVDALQALATKHNIPLIEDAAQSFGASYKGKKSGNLTAISCTSFFPAKPLGCYGDGGAIFINDEKYLEPLKQIRVHGSTVRYVHERIGMNGRMDSIQCAVINAKLPKFAWEVQRREEIGMRFNAAFANISDKIRPPKILKDRGHVFGQYTLYVEGREKFVKFLADNQVPTSIHYPSPMHKQKPYAKDCGSLSMPVADRCANHVVSLPMHPYMSENDTQLIIDTVLKAAKNI